MEEESLSLIELYLPWISFVALIFVFSKLFGWAKNKKTGAIIFGALVQMFTPDPYAERTIKVVKEDKKQMAGKSQENDEDFKLSKDLNIKSSD